MSDVRREFALKQEEFHNMPALFIVSCHQIPVKVKYPDILVIPDISARGKKRKNGTALFGLVSHAEEGFHGGWEAEGRCGSCCNTGSSEEDMPASDAADAIRVWGQRDHVHSRQDGRDAVEPGITRVLGQVEGLCCVR